MQERYGVLCFCKQWHNPLLWSHYADKHGGFCLGFDVENRAVRPVNYAKERPALKFPPTTETSDQLLWTKFIDWQYEQELRSYMTLESRDPLTHLYFCDFGGNLQLREVIVGPLCDTSRVTIEKALGSGSDRVSIIKSRLAFNSFDIVENKKGF
jgi:hypothetical protein